MSKSKELRESVDDSRSSDCYTPGPWTVEPEVMGQNTNAIVLGYDVPRMGSPLVIAWMSGVCEHGGPPKSETEDLANAKLMAASPKLMAACEMLVQWDDYGGDAVAMLNDAISTAREAVKDARGV